MTFINFAVSCVTLGLHRGKAGKSEIGCGDIRKLKARKRGCRKAVSTERRRAFATQTGASAKRWKLPAGARASGLSCAARRVRRHGIYSRDASPPDVCNGSKADTTLTSGMGGKET